MKAPGLFIKYSIAFLAVLVLVPHITNATTKDKFLTYSEKTDFVKTPKFDQTRDFFHLLEQHSPMVHNSSFGTSPMGYEPSWVSSTTSSAKGHTRTTNSTLRREL